MAANLSDPVRKENKINNSISLPINNNTTNLPKKFLNQIKDLQIKKKNLNTGSIDTEELDCGSLSKKQIRREKTKINRQIRYLDKRRKKASLKNSLNPEKVDVYDTANNLDTEENKEAFSKDNRDTIDNMKVKSQKGSNETNGVHGLTVQVQNNYCGKNNKKPPDSTKNATITKMSGRSRAIEAMNKPVEIDRAVKMMKQMGWTGGSLGVRGDGITEPIMPALDLVARAGLGHVKPNKEPPPPVKPLLPTPDYNATNFNMNNYHFGQNYIDMMQPSPFLAINFNQIPTDVAHLISKKDMNAINKIYKKEKIKSRNPSDFRLDFLSILLDLISSDRTKIVNKYKSELTKKERSFCRASIRTINARAKLSLHDNQEKNLVEDISRIMKENSDLSVYCDFKKLELELTKISESATTATSTVDSETSNFTQAKRLTRNDIIIDSNEALPNLDQLLSLAPKVTTQKAFDTIKFRVEILLKMLYFLKIEDVVMEIVYDRGVPPKQQNFMWSMVDSVNRKKKNGSNNCECYLIYELIKRLGVWVLNVQFSHDFKKLTITKESNPGINKNLIDFKPGTRDNTDDLMIVEPFIETIIISDDDVNYALDVTEAREGSEDQNNTTINNNKDFNRNNSQANTVDYNNSHTIKIPPKVNIKVENLPKEVENIDKDMIINNSNEKETAIINNASAISNNTKEIDINKENIARNNDKDVIPDKESIKDTNIEENSIEPTLQNTEYVEKSDLNKEIVKDNTDLPIDTKEDILKNIKIEKCEEYEGIKIKMEPLDDYDFNNCIVCLVPKNPKDKIDDKKVIEIQLTISSNILTTKELPLLKCHGVQNGALIYTCHSEKSLDFMKKISSVVSDIKISTKKVDTLVLKFKAFFDFNITYILNMLEKYNIGLSSEKWVVLDTEISPENVTLVTKMDAESINYILNNNLSLYAGIDRVDFTICLS